MRVTVLLLVAWCAASIASADPVDDYVRARLPSTRLPGVSLAVVRDGRIVKTAGYGKASLELDAPATAATVYEIGSISKQIAANAILLLAAWAPITVHHILTHTAGLADFDTGDIGFSYRREYTGPEFVALLGAQPLAFAPGTRWNYTNAFPLLGLVVERASGQTYAEFVRTRIFVPLGLTSARLKNAADVVPHRAEGYLWKDGAYRHGESLRPQVIAANGGVMMNAVDFAAWDIAVSQGRLLRPATVTEMSTPVRLADGTTVSHGLGWFMDTFNGHRFGAHWGTTVTGHSAVIRRYDEGLTVIVLGNLDDAGLAVDAMSTGDERLKRRITSTWIPRSSASTAIARRRPRGRGTSRSGWPPMGRSAACSLSEQEGDAGPSLPPAPGTEARLSIGRTGPGTL